MAGPVSCHFSIAPPGVTEADASGTAVRLGAGRLRRLSGRFYGRRTAGGKPTGSAESHASRGDPGTARPIVEPVPFDEAVTNAAAAVFSARTLPPLSDPSARYQVVIDPLVDGMTGSQSAATRLIQTRITQLVEQRYPRFEIKPFSTAAVASSPLVLVGTFTPVNNEGKTAGMREAYRFVCAGRPEIGYNGCQGRGAGTHGGGGYDTDGVLPGQPGLDQ